MGELPAGQCKNLSQILYHWNRQPFPPLRRAYPIPVQRVVSTVWTGVVVVVVVSRLATGLYQDRFDSLTSLSGLAVVSGGKE